MNVAIISPFATVAPHFETELDIAQQHFDAGDSVEFINCFGELANCDFNAERDPTQCHDCVLRRNMGLELLESSSLPVMAGCHRFTDENTPELRTQFDSVEDLISYQIDDFDIGYAVLSSVVSICRDPDPDLAEQAELVNRFIKSAWQAYSQTREYLGKNREAGRPIDRVYVYNGRFSAMRGVLRACQSMKVDCFLHERGCDGGHYELLKNHLPHDLNMIPKAIEDRWAAAQSNPNREQIASSWFHERVNRVEKVWHSFVKDQESGRLPDNFDATQKNISIFSTSDDEFVSIGKEWHNDMYANQVVAIERICRDLFAVQEETHIFLRVHPNLKDVTNQRLKDMMSLDYPNLTVIAPGAPIDTYALLNASDTIVSFGSTVGSEAIFWGKPSVLLGPCYYENLGGVYRARSHEETIDLLARNLEPLEKTGALKYAYWFQTRGFPYKYFAATGLFEGTFKGQTLYARPEKAKGLGRVIKNAKRIFGSLQDR